MWGSWNLSQSGSTVWVLTHCPAVPLVGRIRSLRGSSLALFQAILALHSLLRIPTLLLPLNWTIEQFLFVCLWLYYSIFTPGRYKMCLKFCVHSSWFRRVLSKGFQGEELIRNDWKNGWVVAEGRAQDCPHVFCRSPESSVLRTVTCIWQPLCIRMWWASLCTLGLLTMSVD